MALVSGWVGLLGLIALVGLLTPVAWEIKLIDKAFSRLRKTGKRKPQST